MSIVKNSVLEGNGLTTDQSSSVVIWPSVVVSGVTYTFCEYITTNETNVPSAGFNNPTYIRDIPHLGVVRPTGHDYYPCYNGSTYGVYDKVNHTFTAKTVTAHGEPQPYGVGIWDLMWATASGYTDLLFLVAADGGARPYVGDALAAKNIIETRTPAGGTATTKNLPMAFTFDTLPMPPTKTVEENGIMVTYTYTKESGYTMEHGSLIPGRKPRWNLWAQGAPYRTFTHAITGRRIMRISCLNTENDAPLLWWDGYNPAQISEPFIRLGEANTWEIEYHNGVYVRCDDSNRLTTYLTEPQNKLFIFDDSVPNLPALNMALGNIVDWDRANDHRINLMNIQAQIVYNNAYISAPLVLLSTLPLWGNGEFNVIYPSGAPAFGHLCSTAVKELVRDGKVSGELFDFASQGATINKVVAASFYNTLLVSGGSMNADIQMTVLSEEDTGETRTDMGELLGSLALNTVMKDEDIGSYPRFRMIVRTPTIHFPNDANEYHICNGVYGGGNDENYGSGRFYFKSGVSYTKSGVGMTFLYANQDSETEWSAALNERNSICVLELTTCNALGQIIGYIVLVKYRSKGIYYHGTYDPAFTDPDVDYRFSPWTFSPATSFSPDYLAAAKLPNGKSAGLATREWEAEHTMKVGFFYGNDRPEDIPYSFCDRYDQYGPNESGSYYMIKENTTAVLGIYGDRCALLTGFNSSSVPVHWLDDNNARKGKNYSSALRDFFTAFRGDHMDIGPNSHDIFVYPYENAIANSTETFSTLYFKRYKDSTTLYQDGGITPNENVAPVNYVFLIEITLANGNVYRTGAKFEPVAEIENRWRLLSEYNAENIDHIYDGISGIAVYAELEYLQFADSENRYFDTPQYTGYSYDRITNTGIFKLQIRTFGLPALGILRWSIQNA